MSVNFLYDYIVQGSIVRSRINWYEKGEKNSKYFLNLENIRSGKTAVRSLMVYGALLVSIFANHTNFSVQVATFFSTPFSIPFPLPL